MKKASGPAVPKNILRNVVRQALHEDAAWHDVTSTMFVEARLAGRAVIRAHETGVCAGVAAAAASFTVRDNRVRVHIKKHDGDSLKAGDVMLEARGPLRSLLSSERTALNLLGRLSGIATLTR